MTTSGRELEGLELFEGCRRSDLIRVSSLTTALEVKSGRVLLSEGASDRQFMIIVDGRVGVSRHDGQPVAVLSAGDFFGEISMLTGERRSATVTALTPLSILVSSAAEFSALVETAPCAGDKIIAAAADRIRANAAA